MPTVLAAAALAGLAGFGALRLEGGHVGTVPGVRLRIMQPDVFGDGEFSYENKDALLKNYLALSDRATSAETGGLADVTHLIWPESPFPFILSRDPDALDAIAHALPQGRAGDGRGAGGRHSRFGHQPGALLQFHPGHRPGRRWRGRHRRHLRQGASRALRRVHAVRWP